MAELGSWADGATRTEDWQTLPWATYQRNVYRLQKRIYQATQRGDWQGVHKLQRLLLRSWSARCLAVRQVSQDNRGKRTAGVDGVKNLTPPQRLRLVRRLAHLRRWRVAPIRRTYIPKPGTTERRGLGIPVMADRACQALVKQALEPEWEAQFEPNSYGFRPGRSAHDALEAIFKTIQRQPKFVLDADIEKCFDRINHAALLRKLRTPPLMRRLVRDWLQAGIVEGGVTLFPAAGTPQGGVISPLLANIALHGFEQAMSAISQRYRITLIRYADDFVALCQDLPTIIAVQEAAEKWLAEMGLCLKATKTHLTHTLDEYAGQTGFDFLGFHVRQYRVGQYRTATYRGAPGHKTLITPADKGVQRHTAQIGALIHQRRGAPQAAVIAALNPVISGWSLYYRTCVAKRTFNKLDALLHGQLMGWTAHRHPQRGYRWRYQRYWRQEGTRRVFSDGEHPLRSHAATPIKRHIKVRGAKSPFDGDGVYWGARLAHDPTQPARVSRLVQQQQGRCGNCGLPLTTEDVLEIHHRDGNHRNDGATNLVLLHAHCHDQSHAEP
jgi:RNA-directed DNA polymerase